MLIVKVPLCVVRDPQGRSHYLYEGAQVTVADEDEAARLVGEGFVAEVADPEPVAEVAEAKPSKK